MKVSLGGSIREVGNITKTKTGAWRTFKPVIDMGKCIDCGNCWIFCPDSSVGVSSSEGGRVYSFDLEHCKGCGICANECPVGAIKMVLEEK